MKELTNPLTNLTHRLLLQDAMIDGPNVPIEELISLVRHSKLAQIKDALDYLPNKKFDKSLVQVSCRGDNGVGTGSWCNVPYVVLDICRSNVFTTMARPLLQRTPCVAVASSLWWCWYSWLVSVSVCWGVSILLWLAAIRSLLPLQSFSGTDCLLNVPVCL
jgi:hypothetical protein